MAGSDDGRWDPPRDDDEQGEDEDDDEENDYEGEDDDRVIVGKTRFTRDDFLNAHRSLPGAKAPLVLVPIAFLFVLFSSFMNHEGSAGMLITPMVFAVVFVFVMWRGTRRWANNVFAELHGGHDVTFRFDRHGLAVETSKRQVKVAWEVLHRALETKLAFLVYTSANTVEVVPKRAFTASDLETLGHWLRQRIPTRPTPRFVRNTFLLWLVLIFVFLLIWQFLDTSH